MLKRGFSCKTQKPQFGSGSRPLGGERVRLTQPLQTHYICLTFDSAGSDIPAAQVLPVSIG
jgi:hypothetical protein